MYDNVYTAIYDIEYIILYSVYTSSYYNRVPYFALILCTMYHSLVYSPTAAHAWQLRWEWSMSGWRGGRVVMRNERL